MTNEEKEDVKNFGSYLALFDKVIERGLGELDSVKTLLSLREDGVNTKMKLR